MTEGRLERAKLRLRQAGDVLRCYAEGIGATETAKRLGMSRQTVWRVHLWLGLGRGGRHDKADSILEVRDE